ncbi:hypothetical protein IMSAG117_01049 [Lactobacillaceae bacterium]|nr:hypothetical protein IMSAG117_01049 [Lactobacillaceae bacterium]
MESDQLSVSGKGGEFQGNAGTVCELHGGEPCDFLCGNGSDRVRGDWDWCAVDDKEGICEGVASVRWRCQIVNICWLLLMAKNSILIPLN